MLFDILAGDLSLPEVHESLAELDESDQEVAADLFAELQQPLSPASIQRRSEGYKRDIHKFGGLPNLTFIVAQLNEK